MLKPHSLTMLLLAGALSLQTATASEQHPHAVNFAGTPQNKAGEVCPLCAQVTPGATSSPEVCDDTCLIGNASTYAVLAPVGRQSISMITQGSRLDTLEGKTIALVGGSFMAHVTHPEIKRLILRNYPTAKVILLEEIGSGGPFPGPGVVRRAKDDFQRKLQEMGVQAVISGNGGCGLCTPKETGFSIAAEYLGIPAVTIAGPTFVRQVYSTSVNNGVPAPRAATYPGAFAAHTREELLQNTREILWPQLIEGLTKPITNEEIADLSKAAVGGVKDVVFTGTVDEVHRFFVQNRWSDGLPVIPPTVARVEEFLKFCDLEWDESVGVQAGFGGCVDRDSPQARLRTGLFELLGQPWQRL